MSRCARGLLVVGVLLLLSSPALGHGRPVLTTAAYYYPAYYYPAYLPPSVVYLAPVYAAPAPLFCPELALAGPAYAQPTAAPPSQQLAPQTVEPPVKPGPPKVTESRSFKGKGAADSDGSCCRVGFWNVSGRDVTLTIDGQPRPLPRNRSLTLQLGRQFRWRVDQGSSQAEQVPADKAGLEIVIRQ